MQRFPALVLATSLALGACGGGANPFQPQSDGGDMDGANPPSCTLTPGPPGCGDGCESDADCPLATFCRAGICDAECTWGSVCADPNHACTVQGRCIPRLPDAGPVDPDGAMVCPDIDLSLERIIPNILILLDRSGSMAEDFSGCLPPPPQFICDMQLPGVIIPGCDCDYSGQSRYEAAREFLSGPNGVIRRLQSVARFSMTAYDAADNTCPAVRQTALALDDANRIDQLLREEAPRGGTPTAQAIELLREQVRIFQPAQPRALMLITDGEPNGCSGGSSTDGERRNSVSAVEGFWDEGVPTFVVGIHLDTDHLRDLARAGAGGANAPVWTTEDPDALQAAFEEIISRQIPCTVTVDRPLVPELACGGEVRLNDESLVCNDTQRGWRVTDATTIELLGSACEQWRSGEDVRLTGSFPCEVVVP